VIGDQATWHSPFESMLASDIASLARPISSWVHSVATANDMATDVFAAIQAALGLPGGPATLIVPHDCQWDTSREVPFPEGPKPRTVPLDEKAVAAAAEVLLWGSETVLYLGGQALSTRGLRAARRIQLATRCRVFTETFSARLERGRGIPSFATLPYFPEAAVEALADSKALVTAGTGPPLTVFATPQTPQPEVKPAAAELIVLAPLTADAEMALEALAERLDAPAPVVEERTPVSLPEEQLLGPMATAEVVGACLPEGTIVIDEASTSGYAFQRVLPRAAPHTVLALTGGAIGMGLPVAVGAAVAAPGRRILALQADGSAMYTPQALWTMARERLDVTVLIFANRRYNILQIELKRAGLERLGPHSSRLTTLTEPDLNWVSLANGLGVPASRVTHVGQLTAAVRSSFAARGPHLIEAVI
jgi:acetolactate synthase-1/2/3 large subunit